MLHYNRIDVSEGIDLAKTNNTKECMICHYWCFNHGLKFQDSVYNDCQDLTMLSVNISYIGIIAVKSVDYCCIIHNISQLWSNYFIKKFCAWKLWIYIKKSCLKFQSTQDSFFLIFFCVVSIKWLIVWKSVSL